MTNEMFPVTQTVEFLRVRNFGEGYKGKYAVCEGISNGIQCKFIVAAEEFPLDVLNKIKERTNLRVNPNEKGLRAVKIEYQDIEVLKLNQEDIRVELADIKTWQKNSEQRSIERDITLFKWMEFVEEAIHLNTKDLNKFRDIFFHTTKDENDD